MVLFLKRIWRTHSRCVQRRGARAPLPHAHGAAPDRDTGPRIHRARGRGCGGGETGARGARASRRAAPAQAAALAQRWRLSLYPGELPLAPPPPLPRSLRCRSRSIPQALPSLGPGYYKCRLMQLYSICIVGYSWDFYIYSSYCHWIYFLFDLSNVATSERLSELEIANI